MDVRAEFVEAALNGVLRGAVVVAVVWLSLGLRVRVTASARVFVWSSVLLVLLLLMLPPGRVLPIERQRAAINLTAFEDDVRTSGAPPSAKSPVSRDVSLFRANGPAVPQMLAERIDAVVSFPRVITLRAGAWLTLLAYMWLVVASVLLVRVLVGVLVLARLKRVSRRLDDEWQSRLHALCASHHIRRHAILAVSAGAHSPMLVGLRTPFVLVSDALLRDLGADEIELVLLHELEHLRRWHDWRALGDAILRAIFFFHLPLLWVLRRLEVEREIQCDEAVLHRSGQAAQYAAVLTRVAQMSLDQRTSLAPGVVLRRKHLVMRFQHIFASRPRRSIALLSTAFVFAIFAGATVLVARTPHWIVVHQLPATSNTHATTAVVRADAGAALAAALSSLERAGFAGGVLVARGGKVVLERGYGLSDRARGIRHDTSTVYDVAGITKGFTAAAILQLEADGRLHTSDRIARYIGALPGVKADATIEQLLVHTGGLTTHGSDVQRDGRAAFLQAVRDAPADFVAGERYRYTDIGYSVLAAVVERVSGMPYETYVRERLLQPAHMRTAVFEDGIAPTDRRLAKEYAVNANGFVPTAQRPYVWGRRGALGLVTTLNDLYRWQKALDSGVVLTRTQVDRLYAGLGYETQRSPSGHRIQRRLGGTPTFQAELITYPDDDVVVIFAINNRVGWHPHVWRAIEHALFGEPQGAIQ